MTIDSAWIGLGALALFVVWLAWTLLKTRRRPADAPAAAESVEAVTAAEAVAETVASAAKEHVEAVVMPVVAPAARPAAPAAAAVMPAASMPAASAIATPVATPVPAPRPARPPPQRFERIAAIVAADDAAWDAAVPLAVSAAQANAIAGLCLAALDVDRRSSPSSLLAVSFPAGAVMRIARGDAAMLKSIAADNAAAVQRVFGWLDSQAASALAAHLLAARAAGRHLDELNGDVHDIKTVLAGLPPKLAAHGDGQLKSLVQELSRFMREARDNYASAVAKAAFRERVDEACDRAVGTWRELHGRLDAGRERLAAQADVARFGEAQVEKALADLRETQELRRLQELATRVVAGLHVLRIALGGAAPLSGVDPLQSAAASLQAGADQDEALVPRLRASELSARGDPYVGRGEFEANRVAMRKLLDALAAAPAAAAVSIDRLASAQAAAAEGFPDAAGGDDRWLVRVDGTTGSAEVRRAAIVRLH